MVLTTENIPGREVKKVLTVVFGCCVQMKHIGKDITVVGRKIIGGESKQYTELMKEARRTAMQRLIADAEKLGADVIIGMLYATSQVMNGAAEIIAFGTAIKTY